MPAHPAPAAPPRPRPPALVGRSRELALLRDQLALALAGTGSLVLVGGEAGIGKTALAEALGAEAEARGALVLVGRCYDLSETPPYGPWREALAALPAGPELPPLPGALRASGMTDGSTSQGALFARAHAHLAAQAGRRPLVLLLDDLHWADPASLDLLRVLARQLGPLPLLLLAVHRSDEPGPLAALLPALVRESRPTRLDLRRLGDEAVRALVAARHPLPEADAGRLVTWLQARAEGNPFYLGELLRTLEEEAILRPATREAGGGAGWVLGELAQVRLPTLLRQVLLTRLARLGEEAQHLLAVAAVIGQEVPLDLWRGVVGVEEGALLDVIQRAVEARLLVDVPEGARVRFAHALIRQALYEGLLPGLLPSRRGVWHRRIAEALTATPAPDPDAVAYHFGQAGDVRAVAWLVRAGERAERAHAYRTAADRYAGALALADERGGGARERGWLHFRLAWVHHFADRRQAIAELDAALRLAEEAGDPALAAHARADRGWLRCATGNLPGGLADLAAGVAALDALPAGQRPPPPAPETLDPQHRRGTLVYFLAHVGRYAEARALGERILAGAPAPPAAEPGAMGYADATYALAVVDAALGRPDVARQAFGRAREVYQARELHWLVSETAEQELLWVALPYATDRPGERRRLMAEAEQARLRASRVQPDIWPRRAHQRLLLLEGHWAEARREALAEQAAGRSAATTLSRLAYEEGDAARAWTLVHDWLPAGPDAPPGARPFLIAQGLQRLAAALALDAGDLPTARAWLEAHDRWLAWAGAVLGRAEGRALWAAYHRTAGDLAAARAHAERALGQAGEPRQPLALLTVHRLLGELDIAAGDHAGAARHLDAALALAEACAAPYERALTLLALAELRAATGRREDARALLGEVRAVCTPLDARLALARAEALAAALATRAAPPTYPAGLTAREAEVLRLVAQGLTNAQVGERLCLSPRTVNSYLTTIYEKLGVTSRSAATRFALDHGLR